MSLNRESTSFVDVPLLRPKAPPPDATVELAFVERNARPSSSDFVPAAWTVVEGRVCASLLVGPGASFEVPLELGDLVDVWARIDAAPEDAWIPAGSVAVR